ncbi:Thiol-disulfide oxidoreductase ResA [Phycisphaerae bacterium RAS2]|nr:Thiol-disulfide oxidoreductase ResA [Phycisphaerae bacterium RAS2]
MKKFVLLAAVMFALSQTPVARAVEVGEAAPEIKADYWINMPGSAKSLNSEHLKGRLVLLEFWATWCGPCRESIPHLVELKKKYESKGMLLVALSDEPKSKVGPFVEKYKMPYVVGGGAKSTLQKYGINSLPTAILIGPDGKVLWTGHPAVVDSEIESALKSNPPKKKGSLSDESAASVLKKADKLYREGKFADAMDLFTQVTAEHKGSTQAKKANEQIKKMKGNSTIMEALRRADAGKKCGKWLACARVLAQNGEKADAAKYYDRIINEFGEFEQAKIARAERKALAYEGKTEAAKPSKAAARKAADDDEDEDDDSEDDEDSDDDDEDDDGDEEDDEDDGE